MPQSVMFLSIAFVASSAQAQSESYLCVADQSTGFKFHKPAKQWRQTQFNTDEKFIIRRPNADDKRLYGANPPKWVVVRVGSKHPAAVCNEEFSEVGALLCQGFEDFRFNRKNLRYISTYTVGYW